MKEILTKLLNKASDILPFDLLIQGIKLLILAGVIYALFICLRKILKDSKKKTVTVDEMEGHEFEHFCAGLLRGSGFDEVVVTKGSGDFGVDILAQKEGITYAIQCKRYEGPVGVHAVLEVFAGKAYYDKMVGAVLTNQYFTAPAVEAATKLNIILWDGDYLQTMLEETEED